MHNDGHSHTGQILWYSSQTVVIAPLNFKSHYLAYP